VPNRMVSFTDSQLDFLKAEAEILGVSVTSLVKRIVDGHRLKIRESTEEARHWVLMAGGRLRTLEEKQT
jgi:hypothetical protein